MRRSHKILKDYAAHLVTRFFHDHSGVRIICREALLERMAACCSEPGWCHNRFAAVEGLQNAGKPRCEAKERPGSIKQLLCEWIASGA